MTLLGEATRRERDRPRRGDVADPASELLLQTHPVLVRLAFWGSRRDAESLPQRGDHSCEHGTSRTRASHRLVRHGHQQAASELVNDTIGAAIRGLDVRADDRGSQQLRLDCELAEQPALAHSRRCLDQDRPALPAMCSDRRAPDLRDLAFTADERAARDPASRGLGSGRA